MIGGLPPGVARGVVDSLIFDLELAVGSIALGFAVATAAALLAHRAQPGAGRTALWSVAGVVGATSVAAATWLAALLVRL